MVTARLFLAPLIAGLAGRDACSALSWQKARLLTPAAAPGDRETFLRARWSGDMVEVLGYQDSGAQRALAAADLLVHRPSLAPEALSGDSVDVLEF
jgi:molybdopterin molybdotransferase